MKLGKIYIAGSGGMLGDAFYNVFNKTVDITIKAPVFPPLTIAFAFPFLTDSIAINMLEFLNFLVYR